MLLYKPNYPVMLLMEEILHQLICSLSHYLQGFIHPRWCRIFSINSIFAQEILKSHFFFPKGWKLREVMQQQSSPQAKSKTKSVQHHLKTLQTSEKIDDFFKERASSFPCEYCICRMGFFLLAKIASLWLLPPFVVGNMACQLTLVDRFFTKKKLSKPWTHFETLAPGNGPTDLNCQVVDL